MTYDCIIVGGGPAAITAAIYAARKQMSYLMVTKDIGGQTAWSLDIENYTGFKFITGADLVDKFREHLEEFKINLKEGETVESIKKEGDTVEVVTNQGRYEARTVIIASGREPRQLGVKGEDKFLSKGVAYCATCDAPLFFNKDVAVIGGANSALEAVLQLIKIARKIYLIDIDPKPRADAVMITKAKKSNKVIIYNHTRTLEIYGDKFVSGMKINHKGEEKDLKVQGIFVEIGSVPLSDLVTGVDKNRGGEIMVDCKCETNIPGIYAAGDVTNVSVKQIIVACGEGCKAVLNAFEYLSRRE